MVGVNDRRLGSGNYKKKKKKKITVSILVHFPDEGMIKTCGFGQSQERMKMGKLRDPTDISVHVCGSGFITGLSAVALKVTAGSC